MSSFDKSMVGATSSIERSTVETTAATVASTTEPTAGTTVAVTASPVDWTAAGTVSSAVNQRVSLVSTGTLNVVYVCYLELITADVANNYVGREKSL